MTKTVTLAIAVMVLLTGCGRLGESRLNPFNWFQGDREIESRIPAPEVERDPRPLVDQVQSVTIERTPGGAILRASGLPPTQGHWDPALLLDQARSGGGLLVYQFRLERPVTNTRVSTPQSREVVIAEFLTDQALSGVREIQILGVNGSRSIRR